MNRRRKTGYWRVLFVGPGTERNEAIFHVAEEYARGVGMPLLQVEDDTALNDCRRYYPLVLVSPLQDGDTDASLRILAALGHLDTGFLMFFCERPARFPEVYFRSIFPLPGICCCRSGDFRRRSGRS